MFLRRYPVFLLGVFAAVALLLACVGIFGVVSFGVAERTREFGMAVGAARDRPARCGRDDRCRPGGFSGRSARHRLSRLLSGADARARRLVVVLGGGRRERALPALSCA